MTCSVWLKQVWTDRKLSWNPKNYGGVSVLYVPYEMIWVPDIGQKLFFGIYGMSFLLEFVL
jgi:hypothetical protein